MDEGHQQKHAGRKFLSVCALLSRCRRVTIRIMNRVEQKQDEVDEKTVVVTVRIRIPRGFKQKVSNLNEWTRVTNKSMQGGSSVPFVRCLADVGELQFGL